MIIDQQEVRCHSFGPASSSYEGVMPKSDEMFFIPKISQLDQAIATVIGFKEITLIAQNPARFSRMNLHRQACLIAFEKNLAGPDVEILRIMLGYLNNIGYPHESWDEE